MHGTYYFEACPGLEFLIQFRSDLSEIIEVEPNAFYLQALNNHLRYALVGFDPVARHSINTHIAHGYLLSLQASTRRMVQCWPAPTGPTNMGQVIGGNVGRLSSYFSMFINQMHQTRVLVPIDTIALSFLNYTICQPIRNQCPTGENTEV